MPKKILTERFIQDSVAERLNKEYYRRKPAYVATEAYTRLKRADVFLSFMRARKRPYVIVVEAKSRTTIHQLKLKEAPHQVRWAGRLVAIAFIVGLSVALGYQWYFNAVNTLLLLLLFVAGSSLISAVISKLRLSALGSISAIEQLGRYPANEKWIAVGEDTFVRPEEYEVLRSQCRKNGIGLLVVDARGRVRRRAIPTPTHTFNNYLGSYGKEAQVLKAIDKRPDYGPTPPERAKKRRQLLNIASLLAVVGLLGLVTYEENYRPVVPDPFTYEEDAAFMDTLPEIMGGDAGATEVEEPGLATDPCTALTVERRSFIVVDALLRPRNAPKRIAQLEAAGLIGWRAIPTDCLNSWPAPGRAAVYKDTVFADRPAAARVAKRHKAALEAAGLDFRYGRVVKVRPR